MKKCSPSLSIKEMQIKTTLRFLLLLLELLIPKSPTTANVGNHVGQKEPSYTAGGKVS
jgi:hypothetical protein